jgi:hypothetical protein
MSQSGILNRGVYPPGSVVETIQGSNNTTPVAPPIAPDAANNIILNSTNGNLTFANGAGNILNLTVSNSPTIAYTNVNATPFLATTVMEYLSVDTSALAIAIQLPTTGVAQGEQFIIKDRTGQANINNITITVEGGALIDNATPRILLLVNESVRVIFNGTNYEVY